MEGWSGLSNVANAKIMSKEELKMANYVICQMSKIQTVGGS